MKYRLFITDFDGTLVRDDGNIPQKVKRAIARYRQAGGIFALCTGRMVPAILPRVRELGLDGLVAAQQGSVIFNAETGEILRDEAFELPLALEAVRFLESKNCHIHVYTADKMYSNRRDDLLEMYEKVCRVKAEVIQDEQISAFVEREKLRVVKTLAMVLPEERFALKDETQAALGERYYVTCSAEYLVEILPAGQNKGRAVDFLSQYYGIPCEQIAAIGDQLNDLPMLECAGGKFTPQNGEEALKRIARTVASNEEGGVAEALEYAMGERE